MSRKLASVALLLTLGIWLVQACGSADQVAPPPTPASTPTYVPTYVVYAQALEATALAIVRSLPTPSPIPNLRQDLQEEEQRRYLWRIALPTAVALFPPPPNYDPRADITPYVPRFPWPTEPPSPQQATSNGTLYFALPANADPIGMRIGAINYWVGHLAGNRLRVYAGYQKERPNQGVILVDALTALGGEPIAKIDMYETPAQEGGMRIVGEVGGQLLLRSEEESLFSFDLATSQWVSPPPIPSVSPAISPVPSISVVPVVSPSVPPIPTPSVLP